MICEFGNCRRELPVQNFPELGIYNVTGFALYELMEDGTKVWRSNLCLKCHNLIEKKNREIQWLYPEFKEVE